MKATENYQIKEIAGTSVLIPAGQNVIEYKGILQLNSTAAFIWSQLQEEISYEELLSRLAAEYEAVGDEIKIIRADLDAFISKAGEHGLITM